jgi:inhibitor of cysteine peptidase
MDRKHLLSVTGLLAALVLLFTGVLASIPAIRQLGKGIGVGDFGSGASTLRGGSTERIGTFSSETEFRNYLARVKSLGSGISVGGLGAGMETVSFATPMATNVAKDASGFGSARTTLRVSETNVRTEGVDEPDIVKTDGNHIYYSREARYLYRGGPEPIPMLMPATDAATVTSGSAGSGVSEKMIGVVPPVYQPESKTDIYAVAGSGDVSPLGSIGKTGETLLYGDTLVLFESSGRTVIGYDISDRKNPKERWTVPIGDDSMLLEARKAGDRLYLVERTWTNESLPCPIRPFGAGQGMPEIACTDIYRPATPSPADSIFTAFVLNPANGTVGDKVSFVGSSGQSVVYMGTESLYVTYPKPADPVELLLGFFRENGAGLFSIGFLDRLEKLAGYDIGIDAKLAELSRLIGNEYLGKSQDEQLRLQNEVTNRMSDYGKKHLRELGSTGIVKISLDGLEVGATGAVAGNPLNDFSLDESDGNLRIATTSGGRGEFYLSGISTNGIQSENDVYILDKNLRKQGELLGLGQGERIYSARFIGDRGYLVTFKETDPFYVLDLSDSEHPKKTGELKIPGYSSYLHPLGAHLVLGVGREEGKVKLSLFDVSDPANPREISKYLLDEYWSEATDDRRAFLADTAHKVFFVPGSQGGYVLSYEGNTLSLKVAVAGTSVRRALYIGDTLYVIGDSAIVSYDENTWQKKGELNVR